jgi:hypothetical protein
MGWESQRRIGSAALNFIAAILGAKALNLHFPDAVACG